MKSVKELYQGWAKATIAKLDRRLPKVRLLRGFGALALGGILGMAVSMLGLVYGYWIGERNLITIWCMLLGSRMLRLVKEAHTMDITKETKLKDILAKYPWIKDELYKVNDSCLTGQLFLNYNIFLSLVSATKNSLKAGINPARMAIVLDMA